MIAPPLWRQIQKNNFTKVSDLAEFLELKENQIHKLISKSAFPLNLPQRLAAKIEKGTLNDPILRQFLPVDDENLKVESYIADPLQEAKSLCTPKLLHKYHGRVLLVTTSSCVMHCRYCFRRHFEYETQRKSYEKELKNISEDPTIKEVILSGGDPLSLSNDTLQSLIQMIEAIPHITKLRFHTRFPIGIPERIDHDFLEILANTRLKVWFVIHSNHPKELDNDIFASLSKLQQQKVVILNQSVLLSGVNDNVNTLRELCETLVDQGVIPYYLHQLDRVDGASHFDVPIEKGKQLIEQLRRTLPGYAVPRYVQEIGGEPYKVNIK